MSEWTNQNHLWWLIRHNSSVSLFADAWSHWHDSWPGLPGGTKRKPRLWQQPCSQHKGPGLPGQFKDGSVRSVKPDRSNLKTGNSAHNRQPCSQRKLSNSDKRQKPRRQPCPYDWQHWHWWLIRATPMTHHMIPPFQKIQRKWGVVGWMGCTP